MSVASPVSMTWPSPRRARSVLDRIRTDTKSNTASLGRGALCSLNDMDDHTYIFKFVKLNEIDKMLELIELK